jgi:ABC-type maltose transport system permease subunit
VIFGAQEFSTRRKRNRSNMCPGGQLAAYSLLYSLPSVLLYLVLSRRLGGAFAFGGSVKG